MSSVANYDDSDFQQVNRKKKFTQKSVPYNNRSNYSQKNSYSQNKSHKERQSIGSLKNDCKDALFAVCGETDDKGEKFNVDKLTVEKVRQLVVMICNRDKTRSVSVVQATLLGMIVKYIPHLQDKLVQTVLTLEPIIRELIPQEGQIISGETKNASGYGLLNSACWPGVTEVNKEEYLGLMETLIKICRCNVLAPNSKGETALTSYNLACASGYAPDIPEMRIILSAGIRDEYLRKMIVGLINRFTLKDVKSHSNTFKLAYITNPDMLVNAIFDLMLDVNPYAKLKGHFEAVSNYFNVLEAMMKDEIASDEWETILKAKFTTPDVVSGLYKSFLNRLCEVAVSKLDEKRKFLATKGEDEQACIAIDAIGAIVGEVTSVIGKSHYRNFIFDLIADIKNVRTQSLIATATVHLLYRVKSKKPQNVSVEEYSPVVLTYMTPEILGTLSNVAGEFTFMISSRIEEIVEELTGKMIPLNKFNTLIDVLKIKTKPTKSKQNKFYVLAEDTDKKQEDGDDISKLVDLDKYLSKTPKCLKDLVKPEEVKKDGDMWNNTYVDDWVYARQTELDVESEKQIEKILSIIVNTALNVFTEVDFKPESNLDSGMECIVTHKTVLFKKMLNDIYGEDKITESLNKIRQVDTSDLWDTKTQKACFSGIVKLYA